MVITFNCPQCTLRQFAKLDCASWEQADALLPKAFCMRCMTPLQPNTPNPVSQTALVRRDNIEQTMLTVLAETGALTRVKIA